MSLAALGDSGFLVGLVGLFVGLAGVAVGGLAWFPRSRDWHDRRKHVREVHARLRPNWQLIERHHWVLASVDLEVVNHSRWPVTDVYVLEPACAAGTTEEPMAALVPSLPWVSRLWLEDARHQYEQPVVLQLKDVDGRHWHWTPAENELLPIPRKISMHSRAVQALARRWPWLDRKVMRRLPKWLHVWLWGYDPEG